MFRLLEAIFRLNVKGCICYALSVITLNERKKQPERVVAKAKQPRPEISRRGRFVTATTRSGL
jgi:hypothetical protein